MPIRRGRYVKGKGLERTEYQVKSVNYEVPFCLTCPAGDSQHCFSVEEFISMGRSQKLKVTRTLKFDPVRE